jgi:hypothetical protein
MHIDWTKVKVQIQDKELFREIPYEKIVAYLTRKGWKSVTPWHFSDIWELEDNQLLVPNTTSISDYAVRISDIVRRISELEDRSQIAVVESLLEWEGNENGN